MRPAATYSPNAELGVSTMGPGELNCRVRNGNGCFLSGITTSLIPALKNVHPSRSKHPHICWRRCKKGKQIKFWIKEYGQASRPISTG